MESVPASPLLLDPGDSRDARIPKVGQIWDPTIRAYRKQRVPLALSKSSLSPISPDGRPYTPQSPQSSLFSNTSRNSSVHSLPSTSTSLSIRGSSTSTSSPTSAFRKLAQQPSSTLPQWIFQTLPREIYDVILVQLKLIHLGSSSRTCQTCYLRDLCALSLTSKAWDKVVTKLLYERIHLVGHDSASQNKKHKFKSGTRLRLLRRTLRGRSFLAQLVRELKVPCLYADGDIIPREMIDLVASVVMTCPNLEKLDGFYPIYTHEYDRLTYALSKRTRLKEHIWLIGENTTITERSQTKLPPGLMSPIQKLTFVNYHNSWSSLKTLLLYCPDQFGVLEKDIFINVVHDNNHPHLIKGPGILHRLPSLQHLCIANFDIDDFDDSSLAHLPPLHSLRLQNLEGVTFWGLSEFSRLPNAFSLRSLSLINLDITYISAIASTLLNLKNLKRLTLLQDTSPDTPVGEPLIHPLLASLYLEYLHWEILVPGSAHENLAHAIRAGGFPRLRTLRAPVDPNGQLQALCRPRTCIEMPSDWSGRTLRAPGMPQGGLREARRAAQQRIEDAWNTVAFKVVVEDVDAAVTPASSNDPDSTPTTVSAITEIFDISGFMGDTSSRINYSLTPDLPGSDNAVIDFPDVVGAGREDRRRHRSFAPLPSSWSNGSRHGNSAQEKGWCKGAWNAGHPKGKGWWVHEERPKGRVREDGTVDVNERIEKDGAPDGGMDLLKFF